MVATVDAQRGLDPNAASHVDGTAADEREELRNEERLELIHSLLIEPRLNEGDKAASSIAKQLSPRARVGERGTHLH